MTLALVENGGRLITHRDVLSPLVKNGYFPATEAEKLLRSWKSSRQHPFSLVSGLFIADKKDPTKRLTSDEILSIVSTGLGFTYERIDFLKISLEVVGSILPHAYIERLGIVPIASDSQKVVFLTSEPMALSWVDEVKAQIKRNVEIKINEPNQIKHILNEIYVVQKAFKAMAREQGSTGSEKLRLLKAGKLIELDQLLEKSRGRSLSAQDGHVVKIVDWLINFAQLERASDIHLEPKKGLGQIRFRVDGDLRTVYRIDHEALLMVIARFKILGDMKLDEKRRPQDGGFKRELENGKQVEMRISTLPTSHGEKLLFEFLIKMWPAKIWVSLALVQTI
jgi:general secretion pathway protein E